MNLKTGIKTLAVMLPMAVAPLKSGAQTVTKQAQKACAEDVMKFKGSVGVGFGVDPFFNKAMLEPKVSGKLSFSTYNMNGSVRGSYGASTQSIDASIAYPIKFANPDLKTDVGFYAKYQHINKNSDISPVVLKKDLEGGSIPYYQGAGYVGGYVEPRYHVSDKLTLSARAEVGSYNLIEKGDIPDKSYILSSDAVKNVKESGIVGNFGLGAEYNLHKNASVSADVSYSTLHKTPGVSVGTNVKF